MEKTIYKVIGLMSGTSLDGLDIAYCHFILENKNWKFKLIECKSVSYSAKLEAQLKNAINLSVQELQQLNVEYGAYLGSEVKAFITKFSLEVDFIASHGHTVLHQPQKGFTLQIGSGQEIAIASGVKIISDFRKKDVAFGGQGAPLVPVGDKHLFGQYIACLNLGGIANISFNADGQRIAFDIGIANMLLNHLANKVGKSFDTSGKIAANGQVNEAVLSQLNSLSYFDLPYPKSLGYEWFVSKVLPLIEASNLSVEDLMATSVEHEAIQIGRVLVNNINGNGEVLITGGGAFNTFLIDRIKFYTPSKLSIIIPDSSIIEFKESIIFGFMGVLRERNEPNCLKSVTGASVDVSGGEYFMPL
ncbi:MAG: anhydro-N-acetylmuramic acid kinase [Cyclobacteriaceae bacterium]|nr:anhydro-N-acetylmuramic acid kinase [Cyclobacteriaceae bacterium]